jgi:hypothetical protein
MLLFGLLNRHKIQVQGVRLIYHHFQFVRGVRQVGSDGFPDAFHHEIMFTSIGNYTSHIQINVLQTIADSIDELSGDDLVRLLLIHYQHISSPLPVYG